MIDTDGIRQRWEAVGVKLDERGRRLFAAGEVQAAGYGALALVSAITGIARSTINRGQDDLDEGPLPEGRIRRKGGGGKPLAERDRTPVPDLKRLVEPATLGDPMRPLIWVSKSLDKLALALKEMGYAISANTGEHHAKREVIVYDYVDSGVAMLARMALKRQTGYRSLGYEISTASPAAK